MGKKTRRKKGRRVIKGGFTDFDPHIGDPYDAYADDGMYGYDI